MIALVIATLLLMATLALLFSLLFERFALEKRRVGTIVLLIVCCLYFLSQAVFEIIRVIQA